MEAVVGMGRFSKDFLDNQKKIIEDRLLKYKDPERINDELLAGDVSPYTRYKQKVLMPILEKILLKMVTGDYGVCEVCGQDIELHRLKIVPAAERCVACMV